MRLVGLVRQAKVLATALIVSATACSDQTLELSSQAQYSWIHMQGNLLAQKKLLQLGELAATDTLITDVNLVDVKAGTVRKNVAVLVRDGKIDWIRDDADIIGLNGINRINGRDQYLAPGLTDMHVHTHDDSDYLLHLAHGVTSIREM